MDSTPQEVDNCQYDLGNLMIFDDVELPFKRAKDNAYLLSIASDHAQLLMNQLCQLPTEYTSEPGRLVALPDATTELPREKLIPTEKPLTKWEKFAKQKGIVKRKRDRLLYDDEHDEWRERYGRNKANDKSSQWAIPESEVKSKDPKHKGMDPWTILESQKKERVNKNKKQQDRNIQMSTITQRKGSANVLDLSTAIGKDAPGKRNAQHKDKKVRTHADIALQIAQKSTNSMGKFDKLRAGEKRVVHKTKSKMNELNKYENENTQSRNVLKKVLGKEKEDKVLVLQKAMHAIGATSISKGEITTLKGIKAGRKLKDKMKSATKEKKYSRVNARIAKGKGQGATRESKKSKGGSSSGGGSSRGGKGGSSRGGRR